MELRVVALTAAALSAKGALRSLGDKSVAHISAAPLERISQSEDLGSDSRVGQGGRVSYEGACTLRR
ncbi:hypothetical protein WJX72_005970 [[Myrmecia] bisecta]|uniref:Secreted protein n=1 Tax=[Myrmecia] bisecta TaxID=41462 RepID=A0AAW1R7X9_9CHLO